MKVNISLWKLKISNCSHCLGQSGKRVGLGQTFHQEPVPSADFKDGSGVLALALYANNKNMSYIFTGISVYSIT